MTTNEIMEVSYVLITLPPTHELIQESQMFIVKGSIEMVYFYVIGIFSILKKI